MKSGHLCRFPIDVDSRGILVPAITLDTRGLSQAAKEEAWRQGLIPDAPWDSRDFSLREIRNSSWYLYPESESGILTTNSELLE